MRYLYLVLSCCLLIYPCLAQKQNNVWMFGVGAGLDFNSGTPVIVPGQMASSEGCASVSDPLGNLLFYSNGNTVWDRNHQVMPNGTGLLGNGLGFNSLPSSTQGVAIVQSFSNQQQYSLFVLEAAEHSTTNPRLPLRYSIVDMSLNGNMGDVTGLKNILLDTFMSEKMTVVPVDCGAWVLTHRYNSREYRAFKVDANGVSAPVISVTGVLPFPANPLTTMYSAGELKVSPDKSIVVQAIANDSMIEIAHFDPQTGIVSNAQKMAGIAGPGGSGVGNYGAGFSPDNSKVYIGNNIGLFQYDLSLLPNMTSVAASRFTVSSGHHVGMRLGPDQKLYISRYSNSGWIGCINNPNSAGAGCNYIANSISIGSAGGPVVLWYQLGNDAGYIDPDTLYSRRDTIICGDALVVSAPSGYTDYKWSDGTNQQTTIFTASGTKWVQYRNLCHYFIDTVVVVQEPLQYFTRSIDTAICFVNSATIQAPSGYDSYLWNDNTTGTSNFVTIPATIWVKSVRKCATRIDTFRIKTADFTFSLGNDTLLCNGSELILNAYIDSASYLWSDGQTTASKTIKKTGTYSVTVTKNGCSKTDTFKLSLVEINPFLGRDTILCNGQSLVLQTGIDEGEYTWQNGSHDKSFTVNEAGTYSVEVTDKNCSGKDTIKVGYEKCDCFVMIPSVFSPNNDALNDKFSPRIDCNIKQYELIIFNRWGEKVFSSFSPKDAWDGTYKHAPVDMGAYHYYLIFRNSRDRQYIRKGDVTVIR